jgi:hypothetical protein
VGPDDESERLEALHDARQVVAALGHRPFVGVANFGFICAQSGSNRSRGRSRIRPGGHNTLRARGLLTVMKSRTDVSPAPRRLTDDGTGDVDFLAQVHAGLLAPQVR